MGFSPLVPGEKSKTNRAGAETQPQPTEHKKQSTLSLCGVILHPILLSYSPVSPFLLNQQHTHHLLITVESPEGH